MLPQSGGIGNAKLLAQKKADFAFSFSLTNQWAYQGKHAYDQKLDMLRGVAGASRETAFGDLHNLQLQLEVVSGDGAVIPFVVVTENATGDSLLRID